MQCKLESNSEALSRWNLNQYLMRQPFGNTLQITGDTIVDPLLVPFNFCEKIVWERISCIKEKIVWERLL